MTTVHIPALLRDLTGGAEQVHVELPAGETVSVRELLRTLEQRHPGLRARLIDPATDDLVPHLAVFIEGEPAGMGLLAKVGSEDNLYFLAPIVGGA